MSCEVMPLSLCIHVPGKLIHSLKQVNMYFGITTGLAVG